jgi:iron(III) transport system substrate-binding protein
MSDNHAVAPVKVRVALIAALFLIVSACGGSGGSNGSGDAAPKLASGSWNDVVAAAKKEGSLVYYGSQVPEGIEELAKRFEQKYGIQVEASRIAGSDAATKLEAEFASGNHISDIVSFSSREIAIKNSEEDWYAPLDFPTLDQNDYDKETYLSNGDTIAVTGATVVGFGWNTDLYPEGLKTYEDFLDPALSGGKIGIADIANSPAIVDFYNFLEKREGTDFLKKLAAQKPRVYESVIPMAAALASGEIAAGTQFASLQPQIDSGAPVDQVIPDDPWGAWYYTSVIAKAPHPNAAMVFANFMLTPEGQDAINPHAASVLPDIPSAVMTVDGIKEQDLSALTPEVVQKYEAGWRKLFE